MNQEAFELLVASLAEPRSSSHVEALLRLQMEHLREGSGFSSPKPSLEWSPEERRRAEERARRELDRADSLGAFLLTPWDQEYPRRLRGITAPPPILYGQGDRGLALERSLAMVGTRTPTRWGVETARRISTYLSERGWILVSGLALGIDRHVHEATLRAGGITVAVLGGSLDRISPAPHRVLAKEIVRGGGLILSELRFGTPSSEASRIRRDRLQSGIASATIVVESELGGGAMHTARLALEQGRTLYVPVPRDSSPFQSRGGLRLLYRDRVALPFEVPSGLDRLEEQLRGNLGGMAEGAT